MRVMGGVGRARGGDFGDAMESRYADAILHFFLFSIYLARFSGAIVLFLIFGLRGKSQAVRQVLRMGADRAGDDQAQHRLIKRIKRDQDLSEGQKVGKVEPQDGS
jgi:hypothetical protein